MIEKYSVLTVLKLDQLVEREIYFSTYCSTILQWLSIFYNENEIFSQILIVLKKTCMIRSTVQEIIQELDIKTSPISEFFQSLLCNFPKTFDYCIDFSNILINNLNRRNPLFAEKVNGIFK